MLPVPTSPVASQDRYHHGDLRRALIDAALDALADGSELPGLRELARRVGVSSAAPYRHFQNRDELVSAVAAEGFARFAATLEQAAAGRPAELHLVGMARAYVRFALDNRPLFQLMFSPGLDRAGDPALKGVVERALAPLTAAAAREAGRRDPLEVALGAWALVHGLSALLLDQSLVNIEAGRAERLVNAITQTFVSGMRAAAGVAVSPPLPLRA
jgi:AcrR family transcriptional regulator